MELMLLSLIYHEDVVLGCHNRCDGQIDLVDGD